MATLGVHLLLCLISACALSAAGSAVLITGASGRTGSLVYKKLKSGGHFSQTRALVRNASKAKEILGCTACSENEGIFEGDVTNASSLSRAFQGVDVLVIAVGVHGNEPKAVVEKIEWQGVKNQVETLLQSGTTGKRVLLISTMGTTDPPSASSNDVFFYKLNAEAFIESSGVPFVIVKPCGLSEEVGGQRELMTGHDDQESWFNEGFYMIPRMDVASVVAEAAVNPPSCVLRFDLCAKGPHSGPFDPQQVLRSAMLPWQKAPAATIWT